MSKGQTLGQYFELLYTLQCEYPELFSHLHRGTVCKWISRNYKRRWSTATMKNVERRCALAGSGRVGILTPHVDTVAKIKSKLQGLRTSGVFINRLITRSIIIVVLQEDLPGLLKTFKCSEVSLKAVKSWR